MHATPQLGLRERKKEATREALIHAAYGLFQEHGYDAVTIDAVAEHALVSRRTFFRYFPTKEAIVFPRQTRRLAAFREELARSVPGLEGVRQACMASAAHFTDSRVEYVAQGRIIATCTTLIATEASLDMQWQEAMTEHLSQTLPAIEAQFLAGAMMGLVRAVLRSWRDRGCSDDLTALGERAFALLPGLAP